MVDSTRRLVISLALCYFVIVLFSPLALRLTRLWETANLSAFRTFSRFALVWFRLFPLPLRVWKGLRLVTVAFPGFFSYPFSVIVALPQFYSYRLCTVYHSLFALFLCVIGRLPFVN